jgi:hypothetical protein
MLHCGMQMNKLWSQTKSKAKTFDVWDSFKEDPETYKVRMIPSEFTSMVFFGKNDLS